ncbi:MAG: hypothetical protein WCC60_13900, partial [Ilumatobacteraceae bacterium]
SLIPTPATDDMISRGVLAPVIETIDLRKIRIFALPVDAIGSEYDVRIVPIAIPGPMTETRLDEILRSLTDDIHMLGNPSVRWEGWNAKAKHRLLQMYSSACVLAEFWNDVRTAGATTASLDSSQLDDTHVRFYFNETVAERVLEAFDVAVRAYGQPHEADPVAPRKMQPRSPSALIDRFDVQAHLIELNHLLWPVAADEVDGLDVSFEPAVARRPTVPVGGACARVDPQFVHRVLDVFGLVFKDLESDQEKRLRDYSYEQYRSYRDDGVDPDNLGPRLLRMGASQSDLNAVLRRDEDLTSLWERAIVSFAVDIGNDIGVCVPNTVLDPETGLVYRHQRAGENAYLVETSHLDIARTKDFRAAVRMLDPFTRGALNLPQDKSDDLSKNELDAFVTWHVALQTLARQRLAGDELVQEWRGTVRSFDDLLVEVEATSTLPSGDQIEAQWRRDEIDGSTVGQLAVDATFIWTVFRSPSTFSIRFLPLAEVAPV